MSEYEIIRPRPQATGLVARVKHAIRSITLGPYNPKDPAIARLFGSSHSSAGVSVSEDTAMNLSAVWCAVNLIASHVGALPLLFYKRLADGGKVRFDGHPLYRMLHSRPNPEMTSVTFREVMTAHVLIWGNAYAEIERDVSGRPAALWPILPWRVTPFRDGGALYYRVNQQNGGQIEFAASDLFHLRGLSDDGINGYSVITKARESLGLGIAAERFGATFFGNGATFGGIISYPPGTGGNPQTREENRRVIESRHQGVDRSHRLLTLYEGAKYEQMGIPPEDAQFLETRQFQITEIARWFNIPPHKLKDLSRATFSNIEHQSIEYVSDCLMPWLRRWESEITAKLISPLEESQQLAEFLVEGLLRGDATTRAAYYEKMHAMGAMTTNEIRLRENLNPLPGGDQLALPKGAA